MLQNTNHTIKFSHFLFLWFGAAVSVAEILAGGLLGPLGFASGLTATILGHLIGTTMLVLGGIIGTRERVPAIESTRISFGTYGSGLFSVINVLQLIGWTAIMIMSAARSANEITKSLWQLNNYPLWSLLIGGLVFIWIALGRESGWKKVNMAAVMLLFGLTVGLSFFVFKDSGSLFSAPATGAMSFSEGIELSVVMPLSWLPLIADYTRFASSVKGAAWGSWLGYFIGSSWMYIIGLCLFITTNNPDPSVVLLAANFGLTALGIIVLATVTTTFMDAYSAGVSFTNICPGLSERKAALAITIIGTTLAVVANMEEYENFLLTIGSVFSPLFAVLLTDYFFMRNRSIRPERLINWAALAVWALGVGLYFQFLKLDLPVGATIPVIIVISALYALVGRYAEKCTYWRKLPGQPTDKAAASPAPKTN